jgi:hypothetical protein
MSRRPDLRPDDIPEGYFRITRWVEGSGARQFLTWRIHFAERGIATLLVHEDGRTALYREGEEAKTRWSGLVRKNTR